MSLTARVMPILVGIFLSLTVQAQDYLGLLVERAQVIEAQAEAIRILADGALHQNQWLSNADLNIRREEIRQGLSTEGMFLNEFEPIFDSVIVWGTKKTQEAYYLLDQQGIWTMAREKAFYDKLLLTKTVMEYFKTKLRGHQTMTAGVERILEINNQALIEAIEKMQKPQNMRTSYIWAKAFQLYYFDFDLNSRFGLKNSPKGRLLKAHQYRFQSLRDGFMQWIGSTELPLNVANGSQEGVVHAAILSGQRLKMPWLKLVQNEHQRDYLIKIFEQVHLETDLLNRLSYFEGRLLAQPEILTKIEDRIGMNVALKSMLKEFSQRSCSSLFETDNES